MKGLELTMISGPAAMQTRRITQYAFNTSDSTATIYVDAFEPQLGTDGAPGQAGVDDDGDSVTDFDSSGQARFSYTFQPSPTRRRRYISMCFS